MLGELLKLIKYKAWANEITFSALSKISCVELYKKRDTNFESISSTLNHVYVVDDIFKSHLQSKEHSYSFRNTEVCPNFSELWKQQKTIDQWYISFVSKLETQRFDDIIDFEYVDGGKGKMSISEIIFHIVNHGTYHRRCAGRSLARAFKWALGCKIVERFAMYSNIKIKGELSSLPSEKDVELMEATSKTKFPAGYKEYITTFGQGVLGGSFVRIYTPEEILNGGNSVKEWRERINEYWFWGEGEVLLTKDKAQECFIIGDTLNGDELCFHPQKRDTIYVLPRDEAHSLIAGNGLAEAIEWLCSSGTLTEVFSERIFEPNS